MRVYKNRGGTTETIGETKRSERASEVSWCAPSVLMMMDMFPAASAFKIKRAGALDGGHTFSSAFISVYLIPCANGGNEKSGRFS